MTASRVLNPCDNCITSDQNWPKLMFFHNVRVDNQTPTATCARDSKPPHANLMDGMSACHNYESSPCLIFGVFLLENERIFMALTTRNKMLYWVKKNSLQLTIEDY